MMSVSDLLHQVRASVRDLRREASAREEGDEAMRQRLALQLRNAVATQSPAGIAVALGSAAELSLLPDEEMLDRCTAVLQPADGRALRGLLWAVRHRHARQRATRSRCL